MKKLLILFVITFNYVIIPQGEPAPAVELFLGTEDVNPPSTQIIFYMNNQSQV